MFNRQRKNFNKKWTDFSTLIKEVSQFIKPFPCGFIIDSYHLNIIAQRVFSDTSKASVIQDSLLSYDLFADINKDPGCPLSVNENWRNILKRLHERHKTTDIPSTIYGIIVQQKYSCSTCVEDYRLNDLPASQTILKPLRRKLYGVLLYEKPGEYSIEEGVIIEEKNEECEIEEMVMCGTNSLDAPVFVRPINPKVNHPGLLALWSNGSFDEKWTLIGDIFGVDVVKVKALSHHLVIPALTLNYLQKNVEIASWEMDALVSSIVLVKTYNAKSISKIKLGDTAWNTRPIRLFTLVSRSYSTTLLIFRALGNPLPLEMTVPTNYQDGKLFHYKYWQKSQQLSSFELCEKNESAIECFDQMMNFICC